MCFMSLSKVFSYITAIPEQLNSITYIIYPATNAIPIFLSAMKGNHYL